MSFDRISDESLARYYESIRQQADANRRHKEHFTASPSVRERADKPRRKMIKRRLQHSLSTGHLIAMVPGSHLTAGGAWAEDEGKVDL